MASRKCERRLAPGWIRCVDDKLPKHFPPDTQFHIRTYSEVEMWRTKGLPLLNVWTHPSYAGRIEEFSIFSNIHSYKIYKGEPSS